MQNVEPYKLLIVDDESGIRDSLKDFFELEGFSVVSSDSGNRALAILKDNSFDLVLSDIRMPEGDGRFLLKSIRQIHVSRPLVVLMSGYSNVTPEEAYAEGATALLSKPFNPVEVMQKVKSYLDDQKNKWNSDLQGNPHYKIKMNSSSIAESIDKKQMSCGQNGLFLQLDPSGYRVGQDIEILFDNPDFKAIGAIRWVRTSESSERPKGMGIELKFVSQNLKNQILSVVESQNISAVIPRI